MDAALREELLIRTREALEAEDWPGVVRLWTPGVEAGDPEAAYQLAYHYFHVWSGPEEDVAESARMMETLRAAAQQDHAEAMWLLATLQARARGTDSEYEGLLRRAGELGSVRAQRQLGVLHATGDWAGAQDAAEAVRWYRLAAEQGDAESQYDLGLMLLVGEGGPKNREEGLLWLERAGAQGEWSALRVLVDCYSEGQLEVPKDATQAALWRERLAEQERLNPPRPCRVYALEEAGGEADFRWLLEVEGVRGYSLMPGGCELRVCYEPESISAAELDERILTRDRRSWGG